MGSLFSSVTRPWSVNVCALAVTVTSKQIIWNIIVLILIFIITLRVVLYCIMPFLLPLIFTLGILVLEVFQVFRQLCPDEFFLVHTLLYFSVFRHKLHV